MNHQFVVVWDNTGLEYIGDITLDEATTYLVGTQR